MLPGRCPNVPLMQSHCRFLGNVSVLSLFFSSWISVGLTFSGLVMAPSGSWRSLMLSYGIWRSDDILSDWRGTCLAQGKVKMVSKPA